MYEIFEMQYDLAMFFELLVQNYVGDYKIGDVQYSFRTYHIDFCTCGLFYLADVKAFDFYMFFDKST